MLTKSLLFVSPRALFPIGSLASISNSAVQNQKSYDAIISGGGMIGLTMACALSKNRMFDKFSILLLESVPKKSYPLNETYSNRVSSITKSSKSLLSRIGAWKHIENARFRTVKDMKVWGSYSSNSIQFAEKHYEEEISYIVENDLIISAVLRELENAKNVEILYGTKIEDLELSKTSLTSIKPNIVTSNNETFECDLLIGADGFNSSIRKAMNVQYLSWNYKNIGIVATLHLADLAQGDVNETAWQKFLPKGPLALLPLTPKMSSLVWSTSKKEAQVLMSLSEESFVDAINESLSSKPNQDPLVHSTTEILEGFLRFINLNTKGPEIIPPIIVGMEKGSRASFPLGFGHAVNYVAEKVALVGDSAHRVHPLAGQGVNLGFQDIQNLEHALEKGLHVGHVLGDYTDLKSYEQSCLRNNLPFLIFTDLSYRVYTSQNSVFKALGNAGLMVAESLRPLKGAMKTVASGWQKF